MFIKTAVISIQCVKYLSAFPLLERESFYYRCRSYPVSVSGDISFKTLVDRNGMESL